MTSSLPNPASAKSAASPAKRSAGFSGGGQGKLFAAVTEVTSGSMNDAAMVRTVVTTAMKNCRSSRTQIAEEMSRLTGTVVTERQLNNFAADSREEYRFPSELERAFCSATGDHQLLICRAELAGFRVIDDQQAELMELGREYLRHKRASAALTALETKLAGVAL